MWLQPAGLAELTAPRLGLAGGNARSYLQDVTRSELLPTNTLRARTSQILKSPNRALEEFALIHPQYLLSGYQDGQQQKGGSWLWRSEALSGEAPFFSLPVLLMHFK